VKQVFWISGACGFVGSSLIQALKKQNSTVYEMRILQLGLQIIDPFSKQVYSISYSSHRIPKILIPTHILHFGAKGVGEPSHTDFHQGNYEMSLKVANYVSDLNIDCSFIFAGSIDEYAGIEFPTENINISKLTHSPYAYWKMRTGNDLYKLFLNNPRIKFSHLRISNLFGLNQRRDTLLPLLINNKLRHHTINHSEFMRDLMYVNDFSSNLVSFLKLSYVPPIINFGRGESIYWRNFVSQAWLAAGKKIGDLNFKESPRSIGTLVKPHMNIDLIRELLGERYLVSPIKLALKLVVSDGKY